MTTRRKVLIVLGSHGDRVKAVEDRSEHRVVVYYRDAAGVAHRRWYPLTATGRAEAKQFVQGWHETRKKLAAATAAPTLAPEVTTEDLWAQFSGSEMSHLRGATILNYRYHWRRWQAFIGRETLAARVTHADLGRFRTDAAKAGFASNQVRQTLQIVRGIYRWAVGARLFVEGGVLAFRWKKGKDEAGAIEPAEYSTAEYEQLLAAFDREDPGQWRAWVFLMLAGHHGQRAQAVRHLRWRDIDEEAGVIRWPALYQKQGVELVQPILWETLSALTTARQWRARAATYRVRAHHKSKHAGPDALAAADWVIFGTRNKTEALAYSALHYHLRQGEARAGVPHLDYRAAHGFRRMVVGEIGERSGEPMLGLEYVGDTDPKMLKKYDKRRQGRIDRASALIESVRPMSGASGNEKADALASASDDANSNSHKDLGTDV
jgi:integrase